jgi:sugar/nucleoside kinase (ribokinase family)
MLPWRELSKKLDSLSQRRPICLLGAAVIDQIIELPTLPASGGDVAATSSLMNIGGCALNVASTLRSLDFTSTNAFLIGSGMGNNEINGFLKCRGIESNLASIEGDNGWCLALVEPDGERTFVTVSGVENNWTEDILQQVKIPVGCLLYVSGYQLTVHSSEAIISWLESISATIDIVIDFGPRIDTISASLMSRVLKLKPIVTVNRTEAAVLGIKGDIRKQADAWSAEHRCPLIVRLDKDGAYFHQSTKNSGNVDALTAVVKDTIGAGDSHAAGVLAGLSADWELRDAIRLGNAIASYVVGQTGGDNSPSIQQLRSILTAG